MPLKITKPNLDSYFYGSVGWGCKIHRLYLCRDHPNECLGYDTKQCDGEAPVVELWGMLSIPSLLSLPGPLYPEW